MVDVKKEDIFAGLDNVFKRVESEPKDFMSDIVLGASLGTVLSIFVQIFGEDLDAFPEDVKDQLEAIKRESKSFERNQVLK